MQHIKLLWCGPLHLTYPGIVADTFNKWHNKIINNKRVTLHILTHGQLQECGFIFLVVCINDKTRGIKERKVTMYSEI